ncbi:hypothetical protein GQX74_006667 [Glossina fuscipes]|nr:hypothetical protein GQX74_006667 [Glossina fuscipes]
MATTLDFEDEGGDDTSSVTICSTSSIHPQTMHYNNRKLEANASSCNNCCAAIIDHHHRHNPHDINNEAAIEKTTAESQHKDRSMDDDCNENMGCGSTIDNVGLVNQIETAATIVAMKTASQRHQPPHLQQHVVFTQPEAQIASNALSVNKNLLLCRRFKDSGDTLRNFNSLPLFVYATSPSTHAISADGVGVAKVAVKAAEEAAKISNLEETEAKIQFSMSNRKSGGVIASSKICLTTCLAIFIKATLTFFKKLRLFQAVKSISSRFEKDVKANRALLSFNILKLALKGPSRTLNSKCGKYIFLGLIVRGCLVLNKGRIVTKR